MKFLILIFFYGNLTMGLQEASHLYQDNQQHLARNHDLSKYKPRIEMFLKVDQGIRKEYKNNQLKTASEDWSLRKGTNYDLKSICGIEGPSMSHVKIVGGQESSPNQWPWQVAIFIDDAWFCAGSLISETYVLTAAHCVDGASYFDVLAGVHDLQDSDEPHRVEISSYTSWTHPGWSSNTLENDIAIIELPTPVDFDEYVPFIRPACLPESGDSANPGELVTAVGWGKYSDSNGGFSSRLRMVSDLPIITNYECNSVYGVVSDGQLCIDTSGGRGPCNGDSGGPINEKDEMTEEGQRWIQVGIFSFGSSVGCEAGYPVGFTRTEYYLDWISNVTGIDYFK